MKKLIINEPIIMKGESTSKMISKIEINEKTYDMYYEVSNEYSEYFSPEVSDSYLVCVLLYCMENGYDIECKGGVSEILLYNLRNYLIPAISKNINKYKAIEISATPLNESFGGKATATGLSCGVDSFYTILQHMNCTEESRLNVTHLTYFNAGASGEYGGEKARNIYEERKMIFSNVAKELNMDFVCVDSNMNEFLMQNHEATHTFRTLSIPLAMQKLFSRYYFSSTFVYSEFKFDDFDPSYYDILTTQLLSTNNIVFTSVGSECTRLEKVQKIVDYDIVKKYINVCVPEVTNCSRCNKCIRTMLNLHVIGKLDDFSDVFDVEYFYEHKDKLMVYTVINKNKVDMMELYIKLRQSKEIKLKHIVYALIRPILAKVYHLFFRKRRCNK